MKFFWVVVIAACVTLAGCASREKASASNYGAQAGPAAAILTPDTSLTGKVVRVNGAARFVVLEFPVGRMASVNQTMFVYHEGLKTAELKVTGPRQDDRIVADVVTGEVKPGDEVRDN